MTDQDEEQQLLKDASTLLMFANVAAKQQVQAQVPGPGLVPLVAPVKPLPARQIPQYHVYGAGSPSTAILNPPGQSILSQPVYQGYTNPYLQQTQVPQVLQRAQQNLQLLQPIQVQQVQQVAPVQQAQQVQHAQQANQPQQTLQTQQGIQTQQAHHTSPNTYPYTVKKVKLQSPPTIHSNPVAPSTVPTTSTSIYHTNPQLSPRAKSQLMQSQFFITSPTRTINQPLPSFPQPPFKPKKSSLDSIMNLEERSATQQPQDNFPANVVKSPPQQSSHSRSSRSSISSLMNSEPTASPSYLAVTTGKPQTPPEYKHIVKQEPFRDEQLEGTQVPSNAEANAPKQKTVSPTSELPSKGSFVSHKRSKSTPDTGKRSKQKQKLDKQTQLQINQNKIKQQEDQLRQIQLNQQQQLPMPKLLPIKQNVQVGHQYVQLSPGTLNASLARGINLETGERNNNNARIAAAALAAAADIPLPLKVISSTKVLQAQQKEDNEDQLTEPEIENPEEEEEEEDDENKTDDERTDDETTVLIKKVDEEQIAPIVSAAPIASEVPVVLSLPIKEAEKFPHLLPAGTDVKITVEATAAVEEKIVIATEEQKQAAVTETTVQAPHELNEKQQERTEESKPAEIEQSVVVSEERKAVFTAPPLSSYQVDPDSGLIGCICGIEDDDGFTIQCDVCFRWQHCLCMGFKTSDEVPEDEYKCYYCDMLKWGKFNPKLCHEQTLGRLHPDKSRPNAKSVNFSANGSVGNAIANSASPNTSTTDELMSDNTEHATHNPLVPKRKRLSSDKSSEKKRKVGNGAEAPTKKKETTPTAESHNSTLITEDILPNKDNELLQSGMTAETYQSVYFNLKSNDYKRPSIREEFSKFGNEFYKEFSELARNDPAVKELRGIEVISESLFKLIKMSKILLPNHLRYLQENKINVLKKNKYNNTLIQVKPYADNQKQKFNGISKLALFISSPGDDVPTTVPANTPVLTYLGEFDLFENYAMDRTNQYLSWGTTKPKVLKTLLHFSNSRGPLDVVLDSRFVGNESRFLRKACPSTSNCAIKPYYIPETNSFQFVVITTEPISLKPDASEELRLSWDWDARHPILKLYENSNSEKFENLSNSDKSALISCVDNILYFTECGCSTSNMNAQCAIFKVKKATSYLLRSTRKVSLISNVNLSKSKEELIVPKIEKEYHSWNERLLKRDSIIQLDLLVTENDSSDELPVNQETDAAIDIPSEGDASLHADVDSKVNVLFKLPYKQQLIARSRDLFKKISIIKNQDSNLADALEKLKLEEEEGEDIAEFFPIIPDVVVRIEEAITNKLKPIVQEVEAKLSEKIEINDTAIDSTIVREANKNIQATLDNSVRTDEVKKDNDNDKDRGNNIESSGSFVGAASAASVVDSTASTSFENKKIEVPQLSGVSVSSTALNADAFAAFKSTEADLKVTKMEPPASVITQAIASTTNAERNPPPKIVKKLSFADYKKKMKE